VLVIQAMREFKALPIHQDADCKQEHVENWRADLEGFLHNLEKTSEPSTKKWHRLATQDVAYSTDWQMRLAGNFGWGTFLPEKSLHIRLHERPRATLTWDMGPDMLCFTTYLLNCKKANVSVFTSALHMVQRCMWGGVSDNGKNGVLVIGTIVANLPRGHFEGEAVQNQLNESARDYQSKTNFDDELLKLLGPKVLRDRGDDSAWSDDTAKEIHANITNMKTLSRKPPRVALTQWNTWNDAFEAILPEWHESLIPKINIGVQQGWCTGDSVDKFSEKLRALDAKGMSDRSASAQETKKRASRLRDGLKAALRVTTFAMLDTEFYEDVFFIVDSNRAWRHFHGKLQKGLVKLDNVKEFHLKMVDRSGDFWQCLFDSMRPFRKGHLAELEKVGILTKFQFGPAVMDIFDDDHPLRLDQRLLAEKMFDTNHAQIASFLKGFIHFYD
jgi:hypothetical protein